MSLLHRTKWAYTTTRLLKFIFVIQSHQSTNFPKPANIIQSYQKPTKIISTSMPQYFPLTSHKYPPSMFHGYFPHVFLQNPHQLPMEIPPYRWSRCPKPVPLIEKLVPKPGLGKWWDGFESPEKNHQARYIHLYIIYSSGYIIPMMHIIYVILFI